MQCHEALLAFYLQHAWQGHRLGNRRRGQGSLQFHHGLKRLAGRFGEGDIQDGLAVSILQGPHSLGLYTHELVSCGQGNAGGAELALGDLVIHLCPCAHQTALEGHEAGATGKDGGGNFLSLFHPRFPLQGQLCGCAQ